MSEFNVRRLPVYLVLDVSGSMAGEPIEAVRQGVRALVSDLRGDPMALENAFLSVVTFSTAAQQVVPLTELLSFTEPPIDAGGSTSLGAALDLVQQCIAREVRKATPEQKGDYRPLVFLMTDGQPTDRWAEAAARINQSRPGNFIACAAGPGADAATLRKITETVVELKSLQPDQLRAFFRWVSTSIKTASVAAGGGGAAALPPPPAGAGFSVVA